MDGKLKILFCGDVEGRFDDLFKKVANVNKKSGPFDFVLGVGNFFGINNKQLDDYINGTKKIPVPTYILGANKQAHVSLYPEDGIDICPNLVCLGGRGVYNHSSGLKIAYLSGVSSDNGDAKSFKCFSQEDVTMLRDNCLRNAASNGVDILLTSQWPTNICSPDIMQKLELNLISDHIAWLAMHIKPRYHLCGLEGIYFERPPYRNKSDSNEFQGTTRFIALSRVANPKKEKWLYALNLTPLDKLKRSEILQRTTDETICPYNTVELNTKVLKGQYKEPSQINRFFFNDEAVNEDKNEGPKKKRQKPSFDQTKCWFCLASPSVEKHLIIDVGTSVYLAIAKGGIVPENLLICPIDHYQSYLELSNEVANEIEKYKSAVKNFFEQRKKCTIFFERNFKTSHMQIQAVPVPVRCRDEIKDIFKEEASGHNFELSEKPSNSRLDQLIPPGIPYFTVELPSGDVLYTKITKSLGATFPVNFAREVLASGPVLNCPGREEWKDCLLSREEEDDLIKKLRADFSQFSPTE